MTQVDLLIHSAKELVTCASVDGPKRGVALRDPGVIRNGAVAIDGELIVGVGDTAAIQAEFAAVDEIDASGLVVTPGFVDAHTHLVFAGSRIDEFERRLAGAGYLEILAGGGGILSTTRETRQATSSELKQAAFRNIEKMSRLGTTTIEIKTGYGLELGTEMKMLEVIAELDQELSVTIVPTFMPAHAVPPEFRERQEEYVDLIVSEMLPAAAEWYRDSHFAQVNRPIFCDVFCEREGFSLAQSRRMLQRARELGFALKAHVDQFTNLGGVALAIELGATSIDHLDTITADERSAIARSGTVAVLTPSANFHSGSCQFADARGLIDAGAAVALTTDFNPGSSPCFSLPFVMAVACRYCRLTPAEALNAVTINAAHAVGMGDRVGSLEIGKRADVLICDLDDYRALAYELGANPVRMACRSGKVVSLHV